MRTWKWAVLTSQGRGRGGLGRPAHSEAGVDSGIRKGGAKWYAANALSQGDPDKWREKVALINAE